MSTVDVCLSLCLSRTASETLDDLFIFFLARKLSISLSFFLALSLSTIFPTIQINRLAPNSISLPASINELYYPSINFLKLKLRFNIFCVLNLYNFISLLILLLFFRINNILFNYKTYLKEF